MNQSFSNDTYGKSFFEYLNKQSLYYPVETVENFLLSIKVKPFLILSGSSGTGKTKLAQAYGKYISQGNDDCITVETEVTLNKADTNNGFTLSADDSFDKLPYDGRRADGIYKVKLGDLETECTVRLSPRLWYRPNVEPFRKEINRLKEQGKEKERLSLYIPSKNTAGANYEIVPVGSNWTESRFIIGYKNVLTGKYTSTKALNLIIKSNRNPFEKYLLVLDEMNLSHVERYFSEFLSAMESGESIQLDSDGAEIPKSIDIGDNLIVIGTVNMDETTYAFSPKVLDRANVIEFRPVPVTIALGQTTSGSPAPAGDVGYLEDIHNGFDVRKMNAVAISEELCTVSGNKSIVNELVADLEQMQSILNKINLSFGFRTIDEIFRFMKVSWKCVRGGEFISWKRFFDAQIKQKILPKIHGNLNIKEALDSLMELCSTKGYAVSVTKLRTMIDSLEKQRYVSFNN